jgi:soluble lytic murein transglycosylase-like protein
VLVAAWPVSHAVAGPYRLVDEDGVTHLTDAPNDPRYRAMSGFSGTESGWLKVPEATRKGPAFGEVIRETAEKYGVSPGLVEAVIRVESAFNPWAVSSKGARGLMQLMPGTAYALGVRDSFNPLQNIEGGVRHLRHLLDRYPGNTAFALAAYNAGEGAVDQYRGIPPYQETRQYVKKVLEHSGVAAAPAAESAPVEPPQLIYRYEDADGTVTFSNLPPVTLRK